MTRIEISRARWGRGQSTGSALKRVDDGKMCCLGFVCLAAGIPEENLEGMGYPHSLFLRETYTAVPFDHTSKPVEGPLYCQSIPDMLRPFIIGEFTAFYRSSLTTDLAQANDDPTLIDSKREARLIEIAAEHGYEFVFVD